MISWRSVFAFRSPAGFGFVFGLLCRHTVSNPTTTEMHTLERWPQVCRVKITFTKLPTNRFVS